MRFSWKFIWATLGSIALVGAIGIGTFAYIFWPHCDREEKTLATDSLGRSTISCFEACTSLGTSMEESIELKSASGKKMTIMKYEPNAELSDAVERPFQGIKRSQLIGAMRALFVFQSALFPQFLKQMPRWMACALPMTSAL